MSVTSLFHETLAAIPKDVSTQVNWSFAIADKIDARMAKTEAEVSRWLGGTHNFTLRTLSQISTALGTNLIQV